MEEVNIRKIIIRSVIAVVALTLVWGSFGTVSAGERGIKTRFNNVIGVVQPGLYFKIPFIDKVNLIEVKTRTINYDKNGSEGDSVDTSQLFGASKDLQDVFIGVVVNYHINPENVDTIFSQYSSTENYETNAIEPIIREVVKSTSAQYTAEELVTKRAEFSDRVNATLNERLASKSAVLERFSVTNFEFSKAFSAAIEAKVTAVQNAEAAKNKLVQVQFEAEQRIATAEAEAQAIKIQADAINSQGGSDYVSLKAVEKWNGLGCTSYCFGSGTQTPLPFFNVNK